MLGVVTALNKYFITDFEDKWFVAMLNMAAIPLLYSIGTFYRHRTPSNLVVAIIFAAELVAVIIGYNLNVTFYSEFIILLCVTGIIFIRKKWDN
jgi:hypothetical protein